MCAKKKVDSRQRSLFDLPDDEVDEVTAALPPIWQEVPQALYLSWSDRMQYAYCARRDDDAAKDAEGAMKEFYEERARCYRSMM